MSVLPTVKELIKNASRLDEEEFDDLLKKLVIIQLQRKDVPTLSAEEADLLQSLNKGFSPEKWERLKYLDWKSEFGTLKENENAELQVLAEEYEEVSVLRLKILSKLADLRNDSIDHVAEKLGIKPAYRA